VVYKLKDKEYKSHTGCGMGILRGLRCVMLNGFGSARNKIKNVKYNKLSVCLMLLKKVFTEQTKICNYGHRIPNNDIVSPTCERNSHFLWF